MRPNKFLILLVLPVLLLIMLMLTKCRKERSSESKQFTDHTITLSFKPVVDGNDLVFGNTYTNPFNESYSVKTFKFYIHGISLINSKTGNAFTEDMSHYYLVNFQDAGSAQIQVPVASGQYDQLSFIIGVDSIYNVSGAQTGALDPGNAMFWTWNSGYIMAKLEGNSPVASTPDNMFAYHIGGFKGPDNVVEKVTMPLPVNQPIDFPSGSSTILNITANVNAWFANPNDITLTATPVCTTPGALAKEVAENYAKMFMVINLTNTP